MGFDIGKQPPLKSNFTEDEDEDDISLDSCSEKSLDDTTESNTSRSERDEKKEVYKMSAKDTFRVQLWRVAVTVVLLLTACAVTLTTYKFLKREETSNFETAFTRFSRTLAEAALEEQENIRDTLRSLSATVSGQAKAANLSWPNVDIDLWEVFGGNALTQAKVEYVNFMPRVQAHQVQDYLDFVGNNIQRLTEAGHMIKHGDLSNLQPFSNETYHPFISKVGRGGWSPTEEKDEYWPSQMYSPPLTSYMSVNHNVAQGGVVIRAIEAMRTLQYETVFLTANLGDRTSDWILGKEVHESYHSQFKGNAGAEGPHTFAIHPVHQDPADPLNSEIVAMTTAGMAFDASLLNLLPQGVEGIICVISNNENQTFTYEIVGPDAYFLGEQDLHEAKYDKYKEEVALNLHTNPIYQTTPGHAQYKMSIYPSDRFRATYDSNTPEVFAIAVAVTFVCIAIVFFVYDLVVFKRNENLVAKAAQSNAIVTSLFPEHMRERLMHEKEEDQIAKDNASKKRSLGKVLKDGNYQEGRLSAGQKPIADLYLESTVMFADITGFTAWSSVREPSQVFTLLETIFHAFDMIARKRKVFKVETVGDCYVAVAGLPDPREDHALAACRFARDILTKFRVLTKRLEVSLGPDTGELDLRIGVHSGQVTAGVLRGDRARFQLFGDTMNVCQRVESTGKGGRIHASRETADLLRKMGKETWVEKRSHDVAAKGVRGGFLESYWINPTGERAGSVTSRGSVGDMYAASRTCRTSLLKPIRELDGRMNRLINWNCEMLLDLMQQIVAQRSTRRAARRQTKTKESLSLMPTANPLDEVKEIIALPAFDAAASTRNPGSVKIPDEVVKQVHLLVSGIARMYNDNPFHNFDHASHVVMSVTKLMSRIVAPSHLDGDTDHAQLHDHTYGITSDPLTQLACAFSALIHDADHVGVSNAQLVKEGVDIASKYNNRSVAEQNSLDLSWGLLMGPEFDTLRDFLFPTQTELIRFRQLVVNSVMSTDIVDKDLKALRNDRWDKAFKKAPEEAPGISNSIHNPEDSRDGVNRKATIVIEHIIQASDISHTMQHWHVYRKWNQNLFEELYVAYLNGRMEKNPVEFWYKGEFGFFDFYIIPLTRKLKECGVFGVSSDEFLNYATKNREMWELHGEEAVSEMYAEAQRKYGVKGQALGQSLLVPEQAPPSAPAATKYVNEVDV